MVLLNSFATVINKALSLDPNTPERLKVLQGKIVEIHIQPFMMVRLVFQEAGIQFLENYREPNVILEPDVIIEGPYFAYLHFIITRDPLAASKKGLAFTGDLIIVKTLQELFFDLEIDWEEELSRWMGDPIAHQLGNFTRATIKKQKEWFNAFKDNTRVFFTEEIKWLPTKAEVEDFMIGVDEIRSDVERLEARIAYYQHKNQMPKVEE